MSSKKIFLLGSGGHAGILYDTLKLNGTSIYGVIDSKINNENLKKYNLISEEKFINEVKPNDCLLINAIGNNGNSIIRKKLNELFKLKGYKFKSVIHPSAIISPNAKIADDIQIMPGVIINSGVKIEENCIINTGAIIEHDCKIGRGCNIAPGAILCGNVTLENYVFIGANATIIQNQTISKNTLIKSSSLVVGKK